MFNKKYISLLLTLVLAFSLCVPVFAQTEYGLIYDETEQFDSYELDILGNDLLPNFTNKYGIELRVDILPFIEGYEDIQDAAETIYDKWDYGYGEGKNGVTLTLVINQEANGFAMDDWYVHAGGKSYELTTNAPGHVYYDVEPYMTSDAWSGDMASDSKSLLDGINAFVSSMESFVLSGGVAETIYNPETGIINFPYEYPENNEDFVIDPSNNNPPYFLDITGTVDSEESLKLYSMGKEISDKNNFGVYAIMIEDYEDNPNISNMHEYAKSLYESFDLGYGEDKSGILLVLSMAERDYRIIVHGFGETAFNEYGREYLSKQFLDDFGYDNFFDGFSDYYSTCDEMIAMALDGNPMDASSSPVGRFLGIIACILLGLLVAFIVLSIFKGQLKSVAQGAEASEYVPKDGIVLTKNYDNYTHTTQVRVYEAPDDDSSSDSDGYSSSGGKF